MLKNYKRRCELATLLEFGAACVGGFSRPILMNESVLVRKESAAARRVEDLRIRVESVARRRGRHGEKVPVLVSDRERARDQGGSLRPRSAAGGRPQLGQRIRKPLEL